MKKRESKKTESVKYDTRIDFLRGSEKYNLKIFFDKDMISWEHGGVICARVFPSHESLMHSVRAYCNKRIAEGFTVHDIKILEE